MTTPEGLPRIELQRIGANGHPVMEVVDSSRLLTVRFTMPNGARLDVREHDGYLEIMGVDTKPLHVEPRSTNLINVHARHITDDDWRPR